MGSETTVQKVKKHAKNPTTMGVAGTAGAGAVVALYMAKPDTPLAVLVVIAAVSVLCYGIAAFRYYVDVRYGPKPPGAGAAGLLLALLAGLALSGCCTIDKAALREVRRSDERVGEQFLQYVYADPKLDSAQKKDKLDMVESNLRNLDEIIKRAK